MDYSGIVEKINKEQEVNCFKMPEKSELSYLGSLDLPKDVMNFYSRYSPIETIEINNVRLLPISEIIEENTNYTPGYILSPLGFCVVASTVEGDVYCIRKQPNNYSIVIASHDEIYEGQNLDETLNGTKQIVETFADFLNAFVRHELVVSFFDVEEN
jgi:hypothetical protein